MIFLICLTQERSRAMLYEIWFYATDVDWLILIYGHHNILPMRFQTFSNEFWNSIVELYFVDKLKYDIKIIYKC